MEIRSWAKTEDPLRPCEGFEHGDSYPDYQVGYLVPRYL